MPAMQAGTAVPLEYTKRHGYMTAQHAVRDVYDALVELVTNCDDSYHDIGRQGGPILIEVEHRRKLGNSLLIVRDRAGGMTLDDMQRKIRKVGEKTSQRGDRGFMGRGAKDCAVLGALTFESIKDGHFHKCQVTSALDFVPFRPSMSASETIREQLGIPRGTGTVVTLETIAGIRVPKYQTLLEQLPRHYALRDVLDCASETRALLRNLNEPESKPEPLICTLPAGEIVFDSDFEVPGYGMVAHLTIWRAGERLQDPADKRFRRTGILIKGKRAIHECTFFTPEFEQEPACENYFGKLACPAIDDLCDGFDARRARGEPHPDGNPAFLLDPNRQYGLRREHPFTRALFQRPIDELRSLVEKEREARRREQRQIENAQTEERLRRLAEAASKFMREKLEEMEQFAPVEPSQQEAFVKTGVLLAPRYAKILVGEQKSFYFKALRRDFTVTSGTARVVCTDPNVDVAGSEFPLVVEPADEKVLRGTFSVEGKGPTESACIQVTYSDYPPAQAELVVIAGLENIDLPGGLAFDHKHYTVKEGTKKEIALRAQYPDVVGEKSLATVSSTESSDVPVRSTSYLEPVLGTNYAEGGVVVYGRRLGASATITAEVNGRKATTQVTVVQKEKEPPAVELKFEFVPYELGQSYRATWDRERPNVLLISAKHESISRYLGEESDNYSGQDTPHFRALLSEIIADNVCRKIIQERARTNRLEFEDVETFYLHHNRLMKEFTPVAHRIQVSDQELRTLSRKVNNQ